MGGNEPNPSSSNVLQYIEIATIGNALDFGDLTSVRNFSGGCSSPVKGICAGGNSGASAFTAAIDIFTIAAKGNASDFGDLTANRSLMMVGCFSNGHGGL